MLEKYIMSSEEVYQRGAYALKDFHGARVYGVPRGGSCALLHLLAHSLAVKPVHRPELAAVIFDDIIDSGATREKYSGKPFRALVDKRNSDKAIGWVVFPWEQETGPEDAVVRLLEGIGEDPKREGLRATPKRVVRALEEMTAGYRETPEAILCTVFDEQCDEIVVLRDIPFVSLCEHHMLPFEGTATVGYLPSDKGLVVGISKLARLVDCFARRLQVQERLTKQIGAALDKCLDAKGSAVVVRATHSCMSCRGVKKHGAEMVTSWMSGRFRNNPEARAEFLALANGS